MSLSEHVDHGLLTLRAEASDNDSLTKLEELITGRREKFGRRERLVVSWQPVPDSAEATASGRSRSSWADRRPRR